MRGWGRERRGEEMIRKIISQKTKKISKTGDRDPATLHNHPYLCLSTLQKSIHYLEYINRCRCTNTIPIPVPKTRELKLRDEVASLQRGGLYLPILSRLVWSILPGLLVRS